MDIASFAYEVRRITEEDAEESNANDKRRNALTRDETPPHIRDEIYTRIERNRWLRKLEKLEGLVVDYLYQNDFCPDYLRDAYHNADNCERYQW